MQNLGTVNLITRASVLVLAGGGGVYEVYNVFLNYFPQLQNIFPWGNVRIRKKVILKLYPKCFLSVLVNGSLVKFNTQV